jgi:hypothetical protein
MKSLDPAARTLPVVSSRDPRDGDRDDDREDHQHDDQLHE